MRKDYVIVKKLLAVLCIVAIAVSVAGCQNDKSPELSVADSSSTSGEVTSQSSISEESSSSVSEMTSQSGISEESSSNDSLDEFDYIGDNYKISANENWKSLSLPGADCAFQYVNDPQTVVSVVKIDASEKAITLEKFCDNWAEQIINKGYTIVTNEPTTFKNMNAYLLEASKDDSSGMILRELMFIPGKSIYSFNIAYAKNNYDMVKDEIDKVLDSFELKEPTLDYVGKTFKISANEKWTATSSEGSDCAFTYNNAGTGLENNVTIGVQSLNADDSADSKEIAQNIIDSYKERGYSSSEIEEMTFKGMKAYCFDIEFDSTNGVMLKEILLKSDNNVIYMFHIGCSKNDYDNVKDEIDKVLDTFEIIG